MLINRILLMHVARHGMVLASRPVNVDCKASDSDIDYIAANPAVAVVPETHALSILTEPAQPPSVVCQHMGGS